jgi:hypothetical protein
MECHQSANLKKCNCTYEPCPRRGRCCECVAYHRGNDELPACFFSTRAEKTYDRSVEAFLTDRNR